MDAITNFTRGLNGTIWNSPFPEPIPDWQQGIAQWSWGWDLHIYGMALLFYGLAILCVTILLRIRRRVRYQRINAFSLFLIFLIGIFRGVCLIVDPYYYPKNFPLLLSRLLFQVVFSGLTTVFSLVQMSILRATKLDVGPNKLQNLHFLIMVNSSHLVLVFFVETVVVYYHKAKVLLLFSHGFFIIWAIFLCVSFIYSGFKLTHYTNETKRAMKELSSYSLAKKRSRSSESFPQATSIQRLTKPKIRITDEDNKTFSLVSDSDSSHSEYGNLGYLSKVFFKHRNRKVNEKSVKSKVNHAYNVNGDYSSTDESMSDESPQSTDENRYHEHMRQTRNFKDKCALLNKYRHGEENSTRNDRSSDAINVETEATDDVNATQADNQIEVNNPAIIFAVCDNGYIADNELTYNMAKSKKNKRRKSSVAEIKEFDDNIPSEWIEKQMSVSTSVLSLFRIRQGRMIHVVVQITYFVTFLTIVICLFQLYAMFGIYGVFASNRKPDPWPWLAFQTFFR